MTWLIVADPEDAAALHGRLDHAVRHLREIGVEASLQTDVGNGGVCCRFWFQAPRKHGASELARAVAETIWNDVEPGWLLRRLKRRKPEYGPEDAAHVVSLALYEIRCFTFHGLPERNGVLDRLVQYLSAERRLHVPGFFRFRLRSYREELVDCLNRAITDFEADREHREFVRLLRYFVEDQDPRAKVVHVVPDPRGSFRLLDEAGETIDRHGLDGFDMELAFGDEVDPGELLISALVTLAPAEVRCHLPQAAWNLAEVEEVFSGRFQWCGGCDWCKGGAAAAAKRRRP